MPSVTLKRDHLYFGNIVTGSGSVFLRRALRMKGEPCELGSLVTVKWTLNLHGKQTPLCDHESSDWPFTAANIRILSFRAAHPIELFFRNAVRAAINTIFNSLSLSLSPAFLILFVTKYMKKYNDTLPRGYPADT